MPKIRTMDRKKCREEEQPESGLYLGSRLNSANRRGKPGARPADGYARIEQRSWNAREEAADRQTICERYRKRTG